MFREKGSHKPEYNRADDGGEDTEHGGEAEQDGEPHLQYSAIQYCTVEYTVQTCHVTVLRLEAVTWTLAAATPAVLMATQV